MLISKLICNTLCCPVVSMSSPTKLLSSQTDTLFFNVSMFQRFCACIRRASSQFSEALLQKQTNKTEPFQSQEGF